MRFSAPTIVAPLVLGAALLLSAAVAAGHRNGVGGSQEAKGAAKAGPYRATWESLAAHPMPEWLLDAKFGIYAHWGVYSVPAFQTEWYPRWMYQKGHPIYQHHVATYGDPAKFGYRQFVERFRAERFDPDEWARLIEASGAKYAGLAVVHHDGFLLWKSRVNRWNAAEMGPKRDLYGDLARALRRRGLKTIATEHHLRTFNWYVPGLNWSGPPANAAAAQAAKEAGWDVADPQYGDLYWNELAGRKLPDFLVEWQAKVREVIDHYQPDVLWFDGGQFRDQQSERIVLDLLAHYHNRAAEWGKPVEVLNKLPGTMVFNFPENYGMLTFEEGRDRKARVPRPWIDDMKISDRGWGYVEGQVYKPANEVVDGLVDRVARGGGLLLNLSPRADGTIPEEQQRTLKGIGDWLKVNGEAIYGTRPWTVHAEGDEAKLITTARHPQWKFDRADASDIRFTQSKDGARLYAFCLGVPAEAVRIRSLGSAAGRGRVAEVRLLGSGEEVRWRQEAEALVIEPPGKASSALALAYQVGLGK